MNNTIGPNVSFKALHISSKQKFAKRLGEEAAEKIYKLKPELEKLAKDVNISITPNFFWLESNWTKGLDPENIRSFAVKVRKIPKNLGDRFKNFLMDVNIFSPKGYRCIYTEAKVERPTFERAEVTPEFILKHVKRLKDDILE